MTLPGNALIPATFGARSALARASGHAIMALLAADLRPRDILTAAAFDNAIAVDMAVGGSTNTTLHLPAIAHEAGVALDWTRFGEISACTPHLVLLKPAGRHFARDLYDRRRRVGGHGRVGRPRPPGSILPHRHRRHHRRGHRRLRRGRCRRDSPLDDPLHPVGGLAILGGTLAPEGAVVKSSAVAPEMMVHEGPARVFENEEAATGGHPGRPCRRRRRGGHPLRGAPGRAPACAKCSCPPRPSSAWAWGAASPWSPTAAFPAPPRAPASGISRRRPIRADPLPWCKRAISSTSTFPPGASISASRRRRSPPAGRPGPCPRAPSLSRARSWIAIAAA